MSHITSGRVSVAEWMGLIKLDCLAVIRARCGQALAMVVRPHLLRQGGRRRGRRGHSWMTSDPEQGTTSQGWQLPWTRQATCYHLFHSHALRVCLKVCRWFQFGSATLKYTNWLLHFFSSRYELFLWNLKVLMIPLETFLPKQYRLKSRKIVFAYVH